MASLEWKNAITKLQDTSKKVKELKEAKIDFDTKNKINEIIDSIVDTKMLITQLQDEYDLLSSEKKELELKIKSFENWEDEKNNYKLVEISNDIYVFQLQNSTGEANPKFCVHCFGNKKLSILQMNRRDVTGTYYDCPNCGNTIRIPPQNPGLKMSTTRILR